MPKKKTTPQPEEPRQPTASVDETAQPDPAPEPAAAEPSRPSEGEPRVETTFQDLLGGVFRVTRRKVTTHRTEVEERVDEEIEEHLPPVSFQVTPTGEHPPSVG